MGKRYALCIGIDTYSYAPDMNLRFAKADIDSLSKIFSDKERGNFQCINLINEEATKKNILKSINDLLTRENLQNDDLALIYYSGHGKLDEDSNLYLAANDSRPDFLSPQGFNLTSCVHIKELEVTLDNTNAGTIVIILDACCSGAFGKALGRLI